MAKDGKYNSSHFMVHDGSKGTYTPSVAESNKRYLATKHRCTITFEPSEWERLKKSAKKKNLSVSSYIREILFSK